MQGCIFLSRAILNSEKLDVSTSKFYNNIDYAYINIIFGVITIALGVLLIILKHFLAKKNYKSKLI